MSFEMITGMLQNSHKKKEQPKTKKPTVLQIYVSSNFATQKFNAWTKQRGTHTHTHTHTHSHTKLLFLTLKRCVFTAIET